MTNAQKVGRVFLLSVSLLLFCVLGAMALAAAIYVAQHTPEAARRISRHDFSPAARMTALVVLSITVNLLCVGVLLQVRRWDRRLMDRR